MLARSLTLVFAVFAVARDCGDEPQPPATTPPGQTPVAGGGGLISTQSFGSWTCTADARPTFAFDLVKQQPATGTHHTWVDTGTQASLPATVDLASLYLMKDANTPFRNFDYVEQPPGTLSTLKEWTLTADGAAQYVCVRR